MGKLSPATTKFLTLPDSLFDTQAIAHRLTGAGRPVEQAGAITEAKGQAAGHCGHVTPEALRADAAGIEFG